MVSVTIFELLPIDRHIKSDDHKNAIIDNSTGRTLYRMIATKLDESDLAIISALKTVYFMSKNDI